MKQQRRRQKRRRGYVVKVQESRLLDKLLEAFGRLTEPVQVLIVIGLFLLLWWIISNPEVLRGIFRALQIWFAVRSASDHFLR